jgi:4a-hydroxytetrahydrobiopterin dehydratase|tara:strand:+ start:576 stop:911 length:336 start_codon:yes stop_codon:yes gene_type:complete
MEKLYRKHCEVSHPKNPPFGINEIRKYLKEVDSWDVKSIADNYYYLEKEFKFSDFIKSQTFVNKIGALAEREKHHPDISFGWGYTRIKIFTHAISGLTINDFILAAKIDRI